MRNIRTDSSTGLAIACAAIIAAVAVRSRAQVTNSSGEALYMKYCASCHDQVAARIPARDALAKMSPARILRTLDFGLMMSIAYPIRRDEREAVAKFLGTGKMSGPTDGDGACRRPSALLSVRDIPVSSNPG